MRFTALIALAIGFTGSPAISLAQDRGAPAGPLKAVVELYTSQGCSSCPAADRLLGQLAKRDDLVALSLSVDYWDYLGWKDTLASPKFTERQRAYAQARGDGSIYTPQVIVNGLAHVNGSDESQIARAVQKTSKLLGSAHVPVRMSESDGKLSITAGPATSADAKDATLWLAVIAQSVEVLIQRGENQGKTMTYHNVVRELIPIGTWSGKPLSVQLDREAFMRPGADRCAVLMQHGRGGPIIGAALLQQC